MDLKNAIRQSHAAKWALACRIWPELPTNELPRPVFDLTGKTAGMVRFRGTKTGRRGYWRELTIHCVRYNLGIASTAPELFVQRTVAHELAHVVALRLYGNGTHNATWKNICLRLGGESWRCHSYEIAQSQDKRKPVRCGCPNTTLAGPVQYKRIVAGTRRYTCRTCGERVFPA